MKPRIVNHQVSSDANQTSTISKPASPAKKKNQKPKTTLASDSGEVNQSSASIPGLVGGIFKFLSGICKNAADKQMQEGKKSSAYYAARFFEYLFDTVSFLTTTISSWITNPQKIIEDFGKVIDFFKNLWNKLVDWWNGVTGKKPEPEKPQNDVAQEATHQLVEPSKPSHHPRPEHSHHVSQQQTQNIAATQSHSLQSAESQPAAPQPTVSQHEATQTPAPQPDALQHKTSMNSMAFIYSKIGKPTPDNSAAKQNEEHKDEYITDIREIKMPANDVMAANLNTTPIENHDVEEEKEAVASFRMR